MQSVEAPRRREMETENVLGFNIETESSSCRSKPQHQPHACKDHGIQHHNQHSRCCSQCSHRQGRQQWCGHHSRNRHRNQSGQSSHSCRSKPQHQPHACKDHGIQRHNQHSRCCSQCSHRQGRQ